MLPLCKVLGEMLTQRVIKGEWPPTSIRQHCSKSCLLLVFVVNKLAQTGGGSTYNAMSISASLGEWNFLDKSDGYWQVLLKSTLWQIQDHPCHTRKLWEKSIFFKVRSMTFWPRTSILQSFSWRITLNEEMISRKLFQPFLYALRIFEMILKTIHGNSSSFSWVIFMVRIFIIQSIKFANGALLYIKSVKWRTSFIWRPSDDFLVHDFTDLFVTLLKMCSCSYHYLLPQFLALKIALKSVKKR